MLDQVRIILVNPSHPGNIGATARAMKNMGLSQLFLVNPEKFPSSVATARASGANEILADAVVTSHLAEALTNCIRVYATSARLRSLRWPACTPRSCAEQIFIEQQAPVAIVFGREQAGLTNEELALCHFQVNIPTCEHFSSLNLAAAVQVIAYELYIQAIKTTTKCELEEERRTLVDAQGLQGFYHHLQTVLTKINFLDPKQPRMLMQRLQRLFYRAELDKTEVNILRGILSAIERVLNVRRQD